MLKFKKPFSFLVIFLIFVFLLILGMFTYLLTTGVRIKYDKSQKRYLIDVSRNELIRKNLVGRNLSLKNIRNVTIIVDSPNVNPDGIINTTQISPVQKNGSGEVATEIVEIFKDDPEGLYFFKIGWGVEKVGAFGSWDYTKTAFVADVVSFNISTKELKLKIKSPVSMPYSGETIVVIEKCNPVKSYLENENTVTNPTQNLEENIIPGNVLFTAQCSDEKCLEVGPFCKISIM